jgi:hypothetical protein
METKLAPSPPNNSCDEILPTGRAISATMAVCHEKKIGNELLDGRRLNGLRGPSCIESIDYGLSVLIERLHVGRKNLGVVRMSKQL